MHRHVALALAVAVVSISLAAPLARLAGTPGTVTAWWRLLVGSFFTLVLLAASEGVPGLEAAFRACSTRFLLSGIFLAAHFALWFESLCYSSIAASTGIVVVYPVLLGVHELIFSREIEFRTLIGLILGFAGVALLFTPWAGATIKGGLLAFTAAVMAAAYFAAGRRARKAGVPTLQYTFIVYSSALASLSLWLAASRVNPINVPFQSIPYLVALGVVPMIGGHTMLNYALAYLPASKVTSVALLEPYGATLLGWVFADDKPSLVALTGATLSIFGAYLALREDSR